ncbi:CocE/NonD family hydrolase [bacterium]|nr:CocE/NonD family hydrolase [bacterium]
MKRRTFFLCIISVVFFLTTISTFRVSSVYGRENYPVRFEDTVFITSSDGTKLATQIARPDIAGKVPAVIYRSPYGSDWMKKTMEDYARRGYACVCQDTRGRYASEGYFDPFVHDISDGEATLNWVRSQPWSNGVVGAVGHSYVGFTALYLTAGKAAPPVAVVAHNPVAIPSGGLFTGGAMNHHFDYYWALLVDGKTQDLDYMYTLDWNRLFSLLPLRDAHRGVNKEIGYYRTWLEWANGSFGKGLLPDPSMISGDKTAFLLVGGWFDLFCNDVIRLYGRLNSAGSQKRVKLIIGPFDHSLSPPPECDMVFGDWSSLDISAIMSQWMDRWVLKDDNGVEKEPSVRYFLLGENRWVSSDTWPPSDVRTESFYLRSAGSANTSSGTGRLDAEKPVDEPYDRFQYDPGNPVPTVGGILCCLRPMTKAGPMDQAEVETRADVLVYTTGELTEDITIAGPVLLELYAATGARDTDFTGKLVDVFPDGKALNITDGIIRARFRDGGGEPRFIKPGAVGLYRIELGNTANTFLKGHRIRLEVASSNFPRFDRNLNTGGPIGTEDAWVTAEQTVFHDKARPSRLVLPVMGNR